MTEEKGNVSFGTSKIDYFVIRSNKRWTVGIFVDPVTGVYLRVPNSMTEKEISKIVYAKAKWILSKRRYMDDNFGKVVPKEFISGETFLYLGRHYRLKVVESYHKQGIYLEEERMIVNIKNPDLKDDVRELIIKWYVRRSRKIIEKRVMIYSIIMNITQPVFSIGNQLKRWGSCNEKGQIRFNWRIIMAPMTLVDYLVVHELCHVEHKNHSKEFWKLLGSIIPDYESKIERLRKEGALYYF